MKRSTPSIEPRSEEVQDIISSKAPWLVRWSLSFFLLVLLSLLAASWFIHYPQIVQAPFRLTAVNAPRLVQSKVEGKLIHLLVRDRQPVLEGQSLAILESTSDHRQVLILSHYLSQLAQSIRQVGQKVKLPELPDSFDHLGELQTPYQEFAKVYRQYQAYGEKAYFAQRFQLLEKEIADLLGLEKTLNNQLRLQKKDLELAQDEFDIHKKLAKEKVIATLELKREMSKLLAKQLPVEHTQGEIYECISTQSAKRKELLELRQSIEEGQEEFSQSLHTLQNRVEEWKNKFIMTSPLTGVVSYATLLEEMQTVTPRQELFYVSPKSREYFGEVFIFQQNAGKIEVGQKVIIKFDSYPYGEFGLVEGQITYLSDIANRQNLFLAKVALPQGLVTNEKKKIQYKSGMSASAEIITKDVRLLQLFLYDFKEAISH